MMVSEIRGDAEIPLIVTRRTAVDTCQYVSHCHRQTWQRSDMKHLQCHNFHSCHSQLSSKATFFIAVVVARAVQLQMEYDNNKH